ncbi:DNA-binding transcriptional LysR family regulator [Erwinia toletana]|uniref:DNA-binding transcriptional LysR family regulator n=1 Tax=Winslowiella toletana TaxID=92490 RepID=A0ABS4PFL6_9GAMM|nr:LysR family transcriptional regulator [Winslowiella toletana]MBP2170861.1 DNA-binding transcriptional LysR family regulator [Winslowiella toletana]
MSNIRENDFSRIDLNLLTVLLVLHREGSVSRAAEKLHLGQPAVSGALARLREMFHDPLFVRTARGMTPTPRAESLVASLLPMMEQMQQLLFQAPSFSPVQDRHLFRLGMSDWLESWLMPDLLARIARAAPGVNLQVSATDPFKDVDQVQEDKVDVAISVGESGAAGLIRESVTQMRFCTLWHPGQLRLSTPISIDQFVAHDHLLVSYRGSSQSMLDEQLALQGRERRVRYVTPHFSSLPLILSQVPALATVPQGVAAGWINHYGLNSTETPVTLTAFNLSLLWHKRRDNDPALQWLLVQLRAVMGG